MPIGWRKLKSNEVLVCKVSNLEIQQASIKKNRTSDNHNARDKERREAKTIGKYNAGELPT